MRTNEKTTILQEFDDINVKADYFLVKDKKMINCTDKAGLPVGWLHAKVKIDLFEFTEAFDSGDESVDIQIQRLYINEAFIGELHGIGIVPGDTGLILKCAVCIGSL
jgi:hypothetical protein